MLRQRRGFRSPALSFRSINSEVPVVSRGALACASEVPGGAAVVLVPAGSFEVAAGSERSTCVLPGCFQSRLGKRSV